MPSAEDEMEEPSLPAADPNMPKEFQRWGKIRHKGKSRFIVLTGVLAWGIPMFLLMTFVVNRKKWHAPAEIAGRAVTWVIGGACFGWWIWRSSERNYLNYMETRDGADDD
jgi:hypothetical protein